MKKLQLLLALKDKQDIETIGRALYDEAGTVTAHPGATVRLAIRDDLARQAAPFADVPEYDLALEIGIADDDDPDFLVSRTEALIPVITPFIDKSRSMAIIGQEHVLVPGEGHFQLFRSFGRLPKLDQHQFNDHFLNIHSQFGIGLPGNPGYRQLHRDPEITTRVRELSGLEVDNIDGVAQLLFASKDIIDNMGSNPKNSAGASADGGLFIDPDTRRTCIARLVLVAGPLA